MATIVSPWPIPQGRGHRCGGREAWRPADAHRSYEPYRAQSAYIDTDHNTLLSVVHHNYPIAYLPPGSNVLLKKPRREESSHVHDYQSAVRQDSPSSLSALC